MHVNEQTSLLRRLSVVALLVAAMLLGMVPVRALAVEGASASEEEVCIEEPYTGEWTDLSPEELLEGYVEQQFDAALPKKSGGPRRVAPADPTDGPASVVDWAAAAQIREQLPGLIEAVESGEDRAPAFKININRLQKQVPGLTIERGPWTAEKLGVSTLRNENNVITAEAFSAMLEKSGLPDYNTIIDALLSTQPYHLFWYDKTQNMKIGFSMAKDLADDQLGIANSANASITLTFPVVKAYDANPTYGGDGKYKSSYTIKGGSFGDVGTAVAKAQEIVNQYESCSAYDRLKGYCDEICKLASYDNEAAASVGAGSVVYGDPWQLVYVFDGNPETKVVCEGYAKAFKYLCDLSGKSDATCVLVSGTFGYSKGSGPHMWNNVRMDDGRVYLVDVTNCDGHGTDAAPAANYDLFVASPVSGTWDGGEDDPYELKHGWATNTYSYSYADTLSVYGESDLKLSTLEYGEPEPLDGGAIKPIAAAVHTGAPVEPQVDVELNGKALVAGTDYLVTYGNNTTAGTATVTVTGMGNYCGELSSSFEIKPTSIADAQVTWPETYTYTGSALTPKPTVMFGGKTLTEDKDYRLSGYENNVHAGTASVTIEGAGSFTGTHADSFVIAPASIAEATITGVAKRAYTGKARTQKPVVTLGDVTLAAGRDYTLSYKNNVNAGNATVTVTGKGDYTGSCSEHFTITKVAQKFTAKAKAKTVFRSKVKEKAVVLKGLVTVSLKSPKATFALHKDTLSAEKTKRFKMTKAGVIKVPKGTKKGTYKLKVVVTVPADANHTKANKTVTVTIKVK